MKKFIASFPEFKKLSGNVAKHWTLMEELQRQVALPLPPIYVASSMMIILFV